MQVARKTNYVQQLASKQKLTIVSRCRIKSPLSTLQLSFRPQIILFLKRFTLCACLCVRERERERESRSKCQQASVCILNLRNKPWSNSYFMPGKSDVAEIICSGTRLFSRRISLQSFKAGVWMASEGGYPECCQGRVSSVFLWQVSGIVKLPLHAQVITVGLHHTKRKRSHQRQNHRQQPAVSRKGAHKFSHVCVTTMRVSPS